MNLLECRCVLLTVITCISEFDSQLHHKQFLSFITAKFFRREEDSQKQEKGKKAEAETNRTCPIGKKS